jgi:hypothetical protein
VLCDFVPNTFVNFVCIDFHEGLFEHCMHINMKVSTL